MISPASNQVDAKLTPDLGRLKAIAERVSAAASHVENFIERFHGPNPASGAESAQGPDNYRNDLEAIFAQLNRLEVAAAALGTIG